MIVKRIGKDLEGNDHGLIEIIMLTSYGRLRTTMEILRPAGVPDDIRTRHPRIEIYNVFAKWTDLAVEENWREKTENNLKKNLLVSLNPYQIRDEDTQDWGAKVKPLKTRLIFNKIFLNTNKFHCSGYQDTVKSQGTNKPTHWLRGAQKLHKHILEKHPATLLNCT